MRPAPDEIAWRSRGAAGTVRSSSGERMRQLACVVFTSLVAVSTRAEPPAADVVVDPVPTAAVLCGLTALGVSLAVPAAAGVVLGSTDLPPGATTTAFVVGIAAPFAMPLLELAIAGAFTGAEQGVTSALVVLGAAGGGAVLGSAIVTTVHVVGGGQVDRWTALATPAITGAYVGAALGSFGGSIAGPIVAAAASVDARE